MKKFIEKYAKALNLLSSAVGIAGATFTLYYIDAYKNSYSWLVIISVGYLTFFAGILTGYTDRIKDEKKKK